MFSDSTAAKFKGHVAASKDNVFKVNVFHSSGIPPVSLNEKLLGQQALNPIATKMNKPYFIILLVGIP
jgi:hypothetical protein